MNIESSSIPHAPSTPSPQSANFPPSTPSYQNTGDDTIVVDVTPSSLSNKSNEEPSSKMEHFEYADGSSSSSTFEDEPSSFSPSSATGFLTHSTLRNLFLLMGAGVLFPYNALLSTCDYFQLLHNDDHHDDVAGELAASCLTALLLTTLILLPLSTPSPSSSKKWFMQLWTSPSKRVLIGFLLGIILLFLLSLSLLVSLPLSMTSLNTIACLFGIADAISQSGLYVLAAKYHTPAYSAAVTLGSAGAGLLVTILSLFTRALFQTSKEGQKMEGLRKGSALLFSICGVVILGCIYSLLSIMKDWVARGGSWEADYKDTNELSTSSETVENDKNEDDKWQEDETYTTASTSCSSSPNFVTSSPGIALQKLSKKNHQKVKKENKEEGDFNEHSPVLQNPRENGNTRDEEKMSSALPKIHSCDGISDSNHSDSFLLPPPPLDDQNSDKQEKKDQKTKKGKKSRKGKEYHTISFSDYAHHEASPSPNTINSNNSSMLQNILAKIKHSFTSLSHHPRLHIYTVTLSKTWKPTLSLFLNYVVTLSLFPGTIASIKSTSDEKWSLGDWITIVLLTVFNGADVIGRYILNVECLGLSHLLMQTSSTTSTSTDEGGGLDEEADRANVETTNASSSSTLPTADIEATNKSLTIENQAHAIVHHPNYNMLVWYQTLVRFLFFPIFAYCIVPITSTTTIPLISSDVLRCIFVILFGLTNGFVTCANFMIAPTMVTSESERDASSFLLLMALECGLFVGAYLGLVVDLFLNWVKKG